MSGRCEAAVVIAHSVLAAARREGLLARPATIPSFVDLDLRSPLTIVLLGAAGSALLEFGKWYHDIVETRQSNLPFRPGAMYWILVAAMVVIGGGLAWLYGATERFTTPFLPLQIGASAPAIIRGGFTFASPPPPPPGGGGGGTPPGANPEHLHQAYAGPKVTPGEPSGTSPRRLLYLLSFNTWYARRDETTGMVSRVQR